MFYKKRPYLNNLSYLFALLCLAVGIQSCSGYKKAVRMEQNGNYQTANTGQKAFESNPLPSLKESVPLMAADTTNPNSLLWEISGKDLKKPSYLYGTIHIIPKKDFILTDLLKNRFVQTQQLALEIDMDNVLSIFGALGEMFMDDGVTLKDLLTEEEYTRLDERFQEKGIGSLATMGKMKPILLSSMMGESDMGEKKDMTSYEMELMQMAKKRRMPVKGLETASFQMGVLDSIPYEAQAKMLIQALDDEDDESGMYDEMIEMYKNQDLNGLHFAVAAESEGVENFDHALLYIRNHNWIPVIEEMATAKPTFFAVGAAHLPGENGVIELLKKAGYQVVPQREIQ